MARLGRSRPHRPIIPKFVFTSIFYRRIREAKMITLKQNQTASPLLFFMIDSSDHISGKTGLSPTVKLSKNGGTGASPAGSITEVDSTNMPGLYKVAANATDTNTLGPLVLHASATGADQTDALFMVVANDPQSGVFLKNTALPAFEFLMVDTGDNPAVGLTVTSQRSIDGGAFASCANSASELGSGIYKIDLAAADMNGGIITLKFSATGADTRFLTIITTP